MSFQDDVRRFAAKVEQLGRDLHAGVCDQAFSSIVEGSALTGAPGQPVDTGYLKGSWQQLVHGPLSRSIVTNVAYAPVIEDNSRAAFDPRGQLPEKKPAGAGGSRHIKSTVGGHHSVKLTVTGWPRIVASVVQEIGGA